jgi:hypothetical protein
VILQRTFVHFGVNAQKDFGERLVKLASLEAWQLHQPLHHVLTGEFCNLVTYSTPSTTLPLPIKLAAVTVEYGKKCRQMVRGWQLGSGDVGVFHGCCKQSAAADKKAVLLRRHPCMDEAPKKSRVLPPDSVSLSVIGAANVCPMPVGGEECGGAKERAEEEQEASFGQKRCLRK